MPILIKERMRPFSHSPGVQCLIPGTDQVVCCYPRRIVLEGLDEWEFALEGSCSSFTVVQDLEKKQVVVFGKASEFFRVRIDAGRVWIDKSLYALKIGDQFLKQGESFIWNKEVELSVSFNLARLSLGNHKQQRWERIYERLDPKEILPLWHRIGSLVPVVKPSSGTLEKESLLGECCCDPSVERLMDLFRAGFTGMMVPQRCDALHWGFAKPPIGKGDSLLAILAEGARLIQSFFLERNFQRDKALRVLPKLPSKFHCGRLVGLEFDDLALDLEWSKKQIRRLDLRAKKKRALFFEWPKEISSFRVRREVKDRGIRLDQRASITVQEGDVLLFDRFEKF